MPIGFTFVQKNTDDNSEKRVEITKDRELGALLFSLHNSGYDENIIMDKWCKVNQENEDLKTLKELLGQKYDFAREVVELKRKNEELKNVNDMQKNLMETLWENVKDAPNFVAMTDEFKAKMRHFMGLSD